MVAQTGSTYISKVTYHLNSNGIPTFSTTANLKTVSIGDSNNDREREMAAETGNTYIADAMRDISLKFKCKSGVFIAPSVCISRTQRYVRDIISETGNFADKWSRKMLNSPKTTGRKIHTVPLKTGPVCRTEINRACSSVENKACWARE